MARALQVLFCAGILAVCLARAETVPPSACASIDTCVEELRELARDENRLHMIGPDIGSRISHIRTLEGATPVLVRLLADPNKVLADWAAYGLGGTPSIDPAYLPQIIAGLDRGLGWLPPALARMDSDEAVREAVIRFLRSKTSPHNQEGHAIDLAGRRAVPFIVEAVRDRNVDDYLLANALERIGPDRRLAIPALLAIARDEAVAPEVAEGALTLLATMKDESALADDLLALRKDRPELAFGVDNALIGIRAVAAGGILASRLKRRPYDVSLFHQVEEVGKNAYDAGPVLTGLLRDEDWETRLRAAEALGYSGYTPAIGELLPLLTLVEDIRLNLAVARTLGQLRDAAALDALRHVASHHWHPGIRKVAAESIARILDPSPDVSAPNDERQKWDQYRELCVGEVSPDCKAPVRLPVLREKRGTKLYEGEHDRRLEKLAYTTDILSYGPREEDVSAQTDRNEVIHVTPDTVVEHRTPTRQVPRVALRISSGWLVGSDRGEWGGEVVFIADDGSKTVVLDKNVEDIYNLDGRLIAVTGIAHLFLNDGMVYQLARDSAGTWSATPWRALPGAPIGSWLTTNHRLRIDVVGGDSLSIGTDGSMRFEGCNPQGTSE